jgi:8-oxo-dGTP pyrophosphatase MutT (NUDIX family)
MAHLHDKIDFTVSVFVVHKDKVLLRMHEKYNLWLGVGGHIELDEDPNEAALRETKEEVGLTIKLLGNPKSHGEGDGQYRDLVPPKYLNRHSVSPTHEHIDFIYFGLSDSDVVIPENATDTWVWLDKGQLERNEEGIKGDILFYAKSALEALGTR